MIEFGRSPGSGVVTRSAICSKTSLVCIITGMTRFAILGSGFEIRNTVGIDVTLTTCYLGMFSDQLE
jgi:hypothetical protein